MPQVTVTMPYNPDNVKVLDELQKQWGNTDDMMHISVQPRRNIPKWLWRRLLARVLYMEVRSTPSYLSHLE